jgi:hypothetical protein
MSLVPLMSGVVRRIVQAQVVSRGSCIDHACLVMSHGDALTEEKVRFSGSIKASITRLQSAV